MPRLTITVAGAPHQFQDYDAIRLVLNDKAGDHPPASVSDSEIVFETDLEIRPDREGVPQAWGPAVNRQGDGRRFVYLTWLGVRGGMRERFRRVKVYLNFVEDLFEGKEAVEVRIRGTDGKGGPVCATPVVLPKD